MIKEKKPTFFLNLFSVKIIIAMLLSALLTACQPSSIPPVSVPQTFPSDSQVFNSSSYITATSLWELTNKSSLVIIGKAVGTGNVFNLARDVDDVSRPDPNLFGIGQVYEFEISRYLKGEQDVNGAERISVVQVEGMIILSAQESPTLDDIEYARSQYAFLPINPNSEYILFLEPLRDFPELSMHFTGVAHPWRFVLANGCAYPESPWQDVNRYFHPKPVEDFIELLGNAPQNASESSAPFTYPAPGDGVSSICPERTEPNPYP
ncbi:MAG TPA: hypothetical protein VLM80_06020 [Anaerolineales bacterium]|nr:hypothetical protein [Anaerolineales bacterium]